MKNISFYCLFLFTVSSIYSQDYIFTKSGKNYEVQITNEDSLNYFFTLIKKDNEINTFISKSDVERVIYKDKRKNKLIDHKEPFIDTVNLIKSDFVYLYTGKIIKSHIVDFKTPFLRSNYFLLDSQKYNSSVIKFYKHDSGFFANIRKLASFSENGFAGRVTTGRINIFEYSSTNYNSMNATGGYSTGGYGGMGYGSIGFSTKVSKYFNRGFNDVKEMNYENLALELNDNPVSMHFLEKYNNASNAKLGLGIAGTVLILAGAMVISSQVNAVNDGETDAQQNYGITYGLFGAGFVCYGIAITFHYKKAKFLDLAIHEYNN